MPGHWRSADHGGATAAGPGKAEQVPRSAGGGIRPCDAGQGALSNLERWYLRGVERRHKLPVATRQARIKVGGKSIYLDNLYEEYLVCVELDGSAAHPAGEQWRDKRRDRRNLAAEKIVTMRFGYADLQH